MQTEFWWRGNFPRSKMFRGGGGEGNLNLDSIGPRESELINWSFFCGHHQWMAPYLRKMFLQKVSLSNIFWNIFLWLTYNFCTFSHKTSTDLCMLIFQSKSGQNYFFTSFFIKGLLLKHLVNTTFHISCVTSCFNRKNLINFMFSYKNLVFPHKYSPFPCENLFFITTPWSKKTTSCFHKNISHLRA